MNHHLGIDSTVGTGARIVAQTPHSPLISTAMVASNASGLLARGIGLMPIERCQFRLMLIYIDSDNDSKTGWLGYDFVTNRSNVRPGITTLERNDGGGYQWKLVGDLEFRSAGNELGLVIPRSALGIKTDTFTLDFK